MGLNTYWATLYIPYLCIFYSDCRKREFDGGIDGIVQLNIIARQRPKTRIWIPPALHNSNSSQTEKTVASRRQDNKIKDWTGIRGGWCHFGKIRNCSLQVHRKCFMYSSRGMRDWWKVKVKPVSHPGSSPSQIAEEEKPRKPDSFFYVREWLTDGFQPMSAVHT